MSFIHLSSIKLSSNCVSSNGIYENLQKVLKHNSTISSCVLIYFSYITKKKKKEKSMLLL